MTNRYKEQLYLEFQAFKKAANLPDGADLQDVINHYADAQCGRMLAVLQKGRMGPHNLDAYGVNNG